MTGEIGGISKTIHYKGNRIDIGGHRFFSKIDRVVSWWTNILPLQGSPSLDCRELGRDVPLERYACQQRLGQESPTRTAAPDQNSLQGHALSAPAAPHILPAPFLRLSGASQRKYNPQSRHTENHTDRPPLSAGHNHTDQGCAVTGGFLHQPFRTGALSYLLQGLHRKGLGASLQRHKTGVGLAKGQRAFSRHDDRASAAENNAADR